MSGGSTMKIENFNSDELFSIENNNGDPSISCLGKGITMNEHKKTGLRLTKDMTQTICLFRKYLLTKAQHSIGKTNMEESETIKRFPGSRPLLPPKFGSNQPRHTSFLEQKLLPGTGCDAIQAASSDDKSSTAPQLTIFYSGTINVYNNISADKAQAIMQLLAGESSLSNLAARKVAKTDVATPIHRSNLPSICKLQAELPIARKYSIQRFLEKRRDRIINKSPYASSSSKNEDNDQQSIDGGSNGNRSFSPSPFPSRLGYFLPISTNKCG